MTRAERREAARVLREWAAWCDANPDRPYWHAPGFDSIRKPWWDLYSPFLDQFRPFQWAQGADAATGYCLAAAMIEAGDSA